MKQNPNAGGDINDYFGQNEGGAKQSRKERGNEIKARKEGKFRKGGNDKTDDQYKNNKASKKPVSKRPGKVTRMNNRNSKFSKKKSGFSKKSKF